MTIRTFWREKCVAQAWSAPAVICGAHHLRYFRNTVITQATVLTGIPRLRGEIQGPAVDQQSAPFSALDTLAVL